MERSPPGVIQCGPLHVIPGSPRIYPWVAHTLERERLERVKKQRAFFARLGYYAVLVDKPYDSLSELLDECRATPREAAKLANVTGMNIADCELIKSAIVGDPRVSVPVDNLVYNMTRRINDPKLTTREKLELFTRSFARLGNSEIITPHNIALEMVSAFSRERVREIISHGERIVELASETGEFAIAVVERFTKLGFALGEYKGLVCAVPASSLAFECTRKVFELLGLDPDNVYNFTTYDLLDMIAPDKKKLDSAAVDRVSCILKQDKKPGEIALSDVITEGADKVEIAAIVGNPPYQINTIDNSGREQRFPVYNLFIDMAVRCSDQSILITPARFLSNAGKTPKQWNKKMLESNRFEIIKYYANSKDCFTDVDIKGGVVITQYKKDITVKPIMTFIPFKELSNIKNKVEKINKGNESINKIITGREAYKLSKLAINEHSEIIGLQSKGHARSLSSNAFKILDNVIFFDKIPDIEHEYVQFIGKLNSNREYRYVRKDYIDGPDSFCHYKVILPNANGSGAIGEVLSTPLIGHPLIGHTDTFLSIGDFETESEACACLKYIKTRFARALLGILKVTQGNPRGVWHYVPLQDFSSGSDINWSQPVDKIDEQLFDKYGLDADEREFVKAHITAMK